ncbi:MAG: cytidylate kinase-like family protein [Desulfobacteraceae bacterium]|nr:cytidylate kinase-like family protein [Desulfobacteraceae bacterium]
MNVITITRQVGSWGDYIGVEVAEKMGMRYLDREIIDEAAQQSGIPVGTLEKFDAQKSMLERLFYNINKTSLVPSVPSQALRHSELHSEVVAHDDRVKSLMENGFTQAESARHVLAMRFPETHRGRDRIGLIRNVVLEFAAQGNVVLAGSGSQMFLKDRPGVFHVLVVAPVEKRIKVLIEQEGISWKIAEKRVKENDQARTAYFRKQYKVNWLDNSLYDLVLNTAKITHSVAADVIVKAAESL